MRAMILSMILIINLLFSVNPTVYANSEAYEGQPQSGEEWIVKWKIPPAPSEEYEITDYQPKHGVGKIRIKPNVEARVIETLKHDPNVLYLEPDKTVKIQATATDPLYDEQYYLNTIKVPAAWDLVDVNEELTISIVDTGIDFDHPDLKDSIVGGVNVIDENQSPKDDHGHGTQMAGIIAAAKDNNEGIAGILPGVDLIAVKALDEFGEGRSYDVAKGIRTSVDYGADIIILSLSDPFYSFDMEDAVRYAEEKGVLVVAAVGNRGERIGYPAAFSTVLAVGSVNQSNRVSSYSNRGQELDVVAPGEKILTTTLDGKYTTASGTSLAAPQVAGIAGLIMSKYPDLTPAQIRDLIRYNAVDIEQAGWDTLSGYGLVDAVKSLNSHWKEDYNEPNNGYNEAKVFPIRSIVSGTIASVSDEDWFKVNPSYTGNMSIDISLKRTLNNESLTLTFYDKNRKEIRRTSVKTSGTIFLNVSKSTYYIRISSNQMKAAIPYMIGNRFTIYTDSYEPNNSMEGAKEIPIGTKKVTGTIHQKGDVDWFKLTIPLDGQIDIKLTADTVQIDPVLTVIAPNQKKYKIDDGSADNPVPEKISLEVTKGQLLIGVENFHGDAVIAEYSLEWSYKPDIVDNYEPNNNVLSAKQIPLDETIYAHIGSVADYDWYKINIPQDGFYKITGNNFPTHVWATVVVYTQKYQEVVSLRVTDKETSFANTRWYKKGTYFIRLDASTKFTNQLYELRITKVDSAFNDIAGHWARASINHLAQQYIVSGYKDLSFRPDNPITRAEFVTLMVKVLDLESSTNTRSPFSDVKTSHWAYGNILAAYQKGIIAGFEDGSFRPDDPISRAEMAKMLANGLNVKPVNGSDKIKVNPYVATTQFTDIPIKHWARNEISMLVQLKYIKGYEDKTFRPAAKSTRAEITVLLERIWFAK